MRKSTYKSRMKSYIGMLIAFGIGMVVLGVISQLQLDLNNPGTYAMQLPMIEEVVVVEFEEVMDIDEYAGEEDEDLQAEIDPDDYDGEIVIATADEVITMTIDDDGIKHFTNHLIG
jgi:hypothetical protein